MKTKVALFSLCALTSVVPLALSPAVPQAEARENSFSGGGSVSYEISNHSGSNTSSGTAQPSGQINGETATLPSAVSSNDSNYSRVIISPVLTVKSLGEKNAINLTYSPSMLYGDGDHGNLQQAVTISANWSPTSRWAVNVSNNYQQTDSDLDNINMAGFTPQPVNSEGVQGSGQNTQAGGPGAQTAGQPGATTSQTSQTTTGGNQLADQPGRQKYSTNTFHIDTTYAYWEDSSVNFGYELQLLRYDELTGTNQDHDRHSIFANINHRLNSRYRFNVNAQYVPGSRDGAAALPATDGETADEVPVTDNANNQARLSQTASSNVQEFHISTSIESLTIPHHPLNLTYSLDTSRYDDDSQNNSQIHSLLLGWTWEINPKSQFSLSAGPTLSKQDNTDDSWSYALNAGYNRQWSAGGGINFSASHGVQMQNFSGNTNNNGMTEYWRGGVSVSQALSQNLALNFMATAADQDVTNSSSPTGSELANELAGGSHNTRQYTLGGGLNYNFARWYSLGLNYTYTTQDGDLPTDNYDEHRVMLVLSMQRDFFHW